MKAKKYIIDTLYGEVVINFLEKISNEEIENGIIPTWFETKTEFEYVGIVDVPNDFKEMDFEYVSKEDYQERMENLYYDVCPGISA